jgi:hypothetical protein
MKLTVNLRGSGPQYFAVTTAMRRASSGKRKLPLATAVGPMTGAFTGLISRAVLAALTNCALGSDFMRQPYSAGDFVSGMLFWPFFSFNYFAAISAQQTMLLKRETPAVEILANLHGQFAFWRSVPLVLIWPEAQLESTIILFFYMNCSRKVQEILGTGSV